MLSGIFTLLFFTLTLEKFFDCLSYGIYPYKCPTSENTYIRCWSESLPLGSGTGGKDAYNNSVLVIMPSTKVFCKCYCRNKRNGLPEQGQCDPVYFKNKAQGAMLGDLSAFEAGSEEATVQFWYTAPPYSDENVQGGSDTFRIDLMGEGLIKNADKMNIVFPKKVSEKSTVNCDILYVKFGDVVECFVEPRDDSKNIIAGAVMMFSVSLGEDFSEEVGNFVLGSYLTSDEAGKKLKFQYQAGNKAGVNTITTKFSESLPNALPRGKVLTNGIWVIRTVYSQRTLSRSYAVFSLPIVFWAIIQSFITIK